jgi:pre-mRNA-splicing helicase BRR2
MADNKGGGNSSRKEPDYSYAANHNLVLMTDRSALPRRDNEPTGEPETLSGRISLKEMGSRAQRDTSMLDRYKLDNKENKDRQERKRLQQDRTK